LEKVEKKLEKMDRKKEKILVCVSRTREKGEKMSQEKRRSESDLLELRRKEQGQKQNGEKEEKGDRSGKKRRQRSFLDQWMNWKETERRLRRCTESSKKHSIRNRRKESWKESGQTRETIQRVGVNYGKLERDRKRTRSKEKKAEATISAKTFTVLGVKTGHREKDLVRVRKLRNRRESRPGYGNGGSVGRKRIGRKTEAKERVWRNPMEASVNDRTERREKRTGQTPSECGWKQVKGRYQRQRRQTLSRRRIQSRYPFLYAEKKSKKERN
jgi:hypothetical protein